MKATFVRTLLVTVLSCCFAVQAARTPAQKLELVQSQLDATVKGADLVALTPAVSDILKVDAEAFTTNTLTLTADQARELAVITLSHPRPLSERMRKTVIDLVRIAA